MNYSIESWVLRGAVHAHNGGPEETPTASHRSKLLPYAHTAEAACLQAWEYGPWTRGKINGELSRFFAGWLEAHDGSLIILCLTLSDVTGLEVGEHAYIVVRQLRPTEMQEGSLC